MLWPPSWTSHVTDSPDMIETSLGENESFLTTTLAGEAIAGAAAARAAPTATAKGTERLVKARCLRMGMLLLLVRTRRDAGFLDPCGDCPLSRERALGHPSSGAADLREALVLGAQAVPKIELDALGGELHRAHAAEPRQHRVERLLLGHAGVERLLAAEAGRDLQRLAAVVAEARERVHEELAVGDRLPHLERRVPRGEHRQVVLVEVGDRLRVVRGEVVVGDLVDPRPHELPDELTARLAADGLGDDADRVLRFDEAEWHLELPGDRGDRRQGRLYVGRWTAKRRRPVRQCAASNPNSGDGFDAGLGASARGGGGAPAVAARARSAVRCRGAAGRASKPNSPVGADGREGLALACAGAIARAFGDGKGRTGAG